MGHGHLPRFNGVMDSDLWCPGPDLNRHGELPPADFKSQALRRCAPRYATEHRCMRRYGAIGCPAPVCLLVPFCAVYCTLTTPWIWPRKTPHWAGSRWIRLIAFVAASPAPSGRSRTARRLRGWGRPSTGSQEYCRRAAQREAEYVSYTLHRGIGTRMHHKHSQKRSLWKANH